MFTNSRVRMLFALIAGFVFLALQAIFPDLPFSEEQTLAFFGLLAAYLVGEGLEGERVKDNLKAMLQSWKFRSLLAGFLLFILNAFVPDAMISEEQLIGLIELFSALMVGLGAQGALNQVVQGKN